MEVKPIIFSHLTDWPNKFPTVPKNISSLLLMLLRGGCNSYKKIRNQGWERVLIKNER